MMSFCQMSTSGDMFSQVPFLVLKDRWSVPQTHCVLVYSYNKLLRQTVVHVRDVPTHSSSTSTHTHTHTNGT